MASKQTSQMQRPSDEAAAERAATAAIVRVDPKVDFEAIVPAFPELDDSAVKTIVAVALASGVPAAALTIPQNYAQLRLMHNYIVEYGMKPGLHFYVVSYNTKVMEGGKEIKVMTLSVQKSHSYYFDCVQKYALQCGMIATLDCEVLVGRQAIDAVVEYGNATEDIVQDGESKGKLHPSVSVARARVVTQSATQRSEGLWHYYVMPSSQGSSSGERPVKLARSMRVVDYTKLRAEKRAMKSFTRMMFPVDPAGTSESHRLLVAARHALSMADDAANGRIEPLDTDIVIDETPGSPVVTPASVILYVDEGDDVTFADGEASISELAAELWADQKIAGLAVKAGAAAGPKPDTDKKKATLDNGILTLASEIAKHLGIQPDSELIDALMGYLDFDNTGSLVHFASAIFEAKDGKPNLKEPSAGFVAVREAIDVLAKHLAE